MPTPGCLSFPSPPFRVICCCSLGDLVRSKAWDATLNNKARGQDWVLNHSQNLSLLSQPPNRHSASGSGTLRGRIRGGEGGWRKTQYQLLPWAGTRGCLHASIWHLVNEQSVTVLREAPTHSSGHISQVGICQLPQTQDTSWLELPVGRAPPGQPGRAGWPAEPRMGLTPSKGQDTQSLAEAQTGSVYRICQLYFPLPLPPLPLESWGLGARQAGPEGA